MSYAVARPQASSPTDGGGGPPSSATVYDFICLFTHDLRRKQKRWQDGKLKYHSFNKKIMVYDDRGQFVGDAHWDQEGDLATGDELSLDRGMALVQVEDCVGEKQQDLTDLLDKRAREVEKRRQMAAAKTRPAPRSSNAGAGQQQPSGVQQQRPQRPHLSLSSLVQSPGPIGRAAIPAHSPFEARQQKLHQNTAPTPDAQPTVATRPPAATKRRSSPSPPSKAGFARSLFGATLSLSSCPGPELMAARARVMQQRLLSQAEASSTRQADEETEEPEPVQSSPLFVRDEPEAELPRQCKEQRSTLQPVTRHPIASARAVMRETEEAGNRNAEPVEEDQPEKQSKSSKKRQREIERQARSHFLENTENIDMEERSTAPDISSKKRKKETDASQVQKQKLQPKANVAPRRQLSEAMVVDEDTEEDEPPAPEQIRRSELKAAPRRQLSEPMVVDEDAEDEAPVPRQKQQPKSKAAPKPPPRESLTMDEEEDEEQLPTPKPAKGRREKPSKPPKTKEKTSKKAKVVEEPTEPEKSNPRSNEPRTTLRMRSRQKRGLLMMREPIPPPAEPEPQPEPQPEPEPVLEPEHMQEEAAADRIANTPSPEPSEPLQTTKSPSPEPEQVIIPSSAPPPERHSPAPSKPAGPEVAEPSSDDDLPPPPKRRSTKQRAHSPSPEIEEEPKQKPKRLQRAKRKAPSPSVEAEDSGEEPQQPKRRQRASKPAADGERESEQPSEDDEPRPRRRAAKRATYNEAPEPEHSEEEEEEPAPVQGPRITKLARKGIRSREIIGYIPQGIENMIPGAFTAASFRFGGPPVPVAAPTPSPPEPSPPPSEAAAAPVDTAPSPALTSPITTEPIAKTSIVEEKLAEKPIVETATAEEARAEEPIVEEPVVEEPIVNEPIIEEPIIEELNIKESSTSELPSGLEEHVDVAPAVPPSPVAAEAVVETTHAADPMPIPSARISANPRTLLRAASDVVRSKPLVAKPAPSLLRTASDTTKSAPALSRNASDTAVSISSLRETKIEEPSQPNISLPELPAAPTAAVLPVEPASKLEPPPPPEAQVVMEALPVLQVAVETAGETTQALKPRIANPATRGKKAARREDAAGLAPQVVVPFEPVQLVRMISTRPNGGGRARLAGASAGASAGVAAAAAPAARKPANTSLPGFTTATGTWSRHAHDLLGMGRPERGRT